MRLAQKTASPDFRAWFRRAYPGLERDEAYWRMAEFFLFGTIYDEATGQLRVSRATLAQIAGAQAALRGHRFSGRALLDRFSRDVAPIEYSGWRYVDERARTVLNPVFSAEVLTAAQGELLPAQDHPRVIFASGQTFDRRRQAAIREGDRAAALAHLDAAGCVEARRLLAYMNGLPPHRFARMLRHLPEARAVAAATPQPLIRMRQLSLLRAIQDQPQPFYTLAAKSPRIFSFNESLLRLKREVRKVLTQDWVSFDLRSAQLAICAMEWDVPDVQAFLAAGRSIWDEFYAYFHVERDADLKDACKRALYALIFGASQLRTERAFEEEGRSVAEARRFLAHPLVRAMLAVRKGRIRTIKHDGGAENCFGQWIANDAGNPRSVLAQLAQARELQLLAPVVELACKTDQFTIMVWLHDGFCVDFRDPTRAALWSDRIVRAVNRQATELGIVTVLE
jgi:hypothetical protein